MKVIGLKAENFMRLVFIDIKPNQAVQKISGKNGQGKSSLLNAIRWGLGGAKHAPDQVVREGQEAATVVLETEEFLLRRVATADGTARLSLESRDGKTAFKRPQEMLDKLLGGGVVAFDPVGFSRMKPRDQADLLREVTGLDMKTIDAERKEVFDARTAVNRDVATLKGKLAGMDEPPVVPEPAAEIDVAAFVAEIEAAGKVQAKNDDTRRLLKTLEQKRADAAALVIRLKDELDAAKTTLVEVSDRAARGAEIVAELADPDISAIKARLESAKQHNANVRGARQAKAEADRRANEFAVLQQSLADAERKSALHTAHLDEIDKAKAELLDKTPMPVPGLAVDGDVVTLGGVPFSQASMAQKIRTGLAIGAALNPGIETLLVEEGSCLDEDQLHFVEEWAEERGVQIIMEIVGDVAGGITIEAGRVKAAAQ